MKTRNFVFVEAKRTYSKTYGGSDYTMSVYEIIDNVPVSIGEVKACTRSHMGEESEVWSFIKRSNPSLIASMKRKAKKMRSLSDPDYHLERDYWLRAFKDLGVTLQKLN